MSKKNLATNYTPDTHGIVLDTKAIITGLVTSLVMGGIVGVVGYSRLTDSNNFRITTSAEEIRELQQTKLDKTKYEGDMKLVNYQLGLLLKHFGIDPNQRPETD